MMSGLHRKQGEMESPNWASLTPNNSIAKSMLCVKTSNKFEELGMHDKSSPIVMFFTAIQHSIELIIF